MSIPRNHHYVSQVLIRKFVDNDNNLYTYCKENSCFEEKELTRFDFAETDLNSIIDENGEIDHSSVEDTLNRHIETGFNNHYNKLIKSLESKNYTDLHESMEYLMRMGIIGDMRTPQHQIEMEHNIMEFYRMIYELAADELKSKIEHFVNSHSVVKNKFPIDYKEITDKVNELMGDKIYSIFRAPETDFFFLPDCSSIVIRSQLEDDTILNGKVLLNTARPIGTIIFPIDSNLIIVAQSTKICKQESHGIYELSSELVNQYNLMFLKSSRDKVICKNKEYLKTFIDKHSGII